MLKQIVNEIKEEIIYDLREDWEARLADGYISFHEWLLDQYASLCLRACALTVFAFVAGIFAAYLVWS